MYHLPQGAMSIGTGTVTTAATTTAAGSGSTSTAMLNTVAEANANKLYFGSATDNSELSDTTYVAILKNNAEFGQITPANSMKWVRYTLKNQPGNLFNPKHYAGQVHAWDVVNDDDSWRSFVFFNALGQNYVSMALTAARAADPAAKLYVRLRCSVHHFAKLNLESLFEINDYNIETAGAKATAMLNVVKALQAAKVPIDGFGMESHLIFTALGIEVAVTELDIRMTLPVTPALLAQQQNVVAACKAVAKCVGVTIWDYTDKYSWVPSTFSGQGEACPWDANLVRKPAYDGIAAGFMN
ncbi:Beta-xylanase [Mycena venus]|uniref:Beta-xylanase n=1 Tax=Mycena venus TaxID=2733690 RepID=A0A8H6XM18_9AGAR|nr:Beta-xylanase [Mycena venus]